MKGSVHAAIGASTPVGLAVAHHVTVPQGLVMAAVSAGYALLPDLDSPTSCASRALGGFVHRFAHRLCKVIVNTTSLPRDKAYARWMQIHHRDPYHRSLTHTAAATGLIALVAYGAAWAHPLAAGFIAALGVLLLWPLRRTAVAVVVFGAMVVSVVTVMLLSPYLLALAVAGGYASHIAADACTKAGVPVLWPVTIQGKRWWRIRLLGSTITSGSPREKGPALGVSLASNALLLLLHF